MSKKKNVKFVVLEDESEEKIIETETVENGLEREELTGKGTTEGEETYSKISRITKIGIAILIACIMAITALNSLPFAKVNDYETEYTAFYNSDLEREAYDSTKAPVRVIEDKEVERLYLERIQLIENGIIAIAILSIITILYGYIYKSNEEKNFYKAAERTFFPISKSLIYTSFFFVDLVRTVPPLTALFKQL